MELLTAHQPLECIVLHHVVYVYPVLLVVLVVLLLRNGTDGIGCRRGEDLEEEDIGCRRGEDLEEEER